MINQKHNVSVVNQHAITNIALFFSQTSHVGLVRGVISTSEQTNLRILGVRANECSSTVSVACSPIDCSPVRTLNGRAFLFYYVVGRCSSSPSFTTLQPIHSSGWGVASMQLRSTENLTKFPV